jgi:hypothetical protein
MKSPVLLSRVRAAMLVFGFFLVVSALSTARSAKNEEPMLTVTFISAKTDYSLADDIRLDIRATNAGKSPLTVFGELLWGHAGTLVLRVTDTSNKEIPAKALDDVMGKQKWCPGWESNPHEEKSPEDFKSSASAIPPPGRPALQI